MSGVGIGGKEKRKVIFLLKTLKAPLQARTGCAVVVVGTAVRVAPASPSGTGASRLAATTTGVFVLPGLSVRIVLPGPLNQKLHITMSPSRVENGVPSKTKLEEHRERIKRAVLGFTLL